MTPNIKDKDVEWIDEYINTAQPHAQKRQYTIVYPMLLVMLYWHVSAVYGLYLSFSAKWATLFLCFFMYVLGAIGVTVGVHRLWSHRAYKATLPLQILLMLCHSVTCQQSAIQWARDHRVHHKYTDTDADPHNSTRGFFFCHVGWLLVKKHPDLIEKSKTIDISDLLNNPVLKFQKKYYSVLTLLLVFILPTVIPVYCWQESWNTAWHVGLLRLTIMSNLIFAINSVAHRFGNKPYDKNISSTQNVPLAVVSFGEGYHNFHHVFPFDYRISELGSQRFQLVTHLIEFFAKIGWAYDLKYASDEMILRRAKKAGDGTHPSVKLQQNCGDGTDMIWGWGDEDMAEEDKKELCNQSNRNNKFAMQILNRKSGNFES